MRSCERLALVMDMDECMIHTKFSHVQSVRPTQVLEENFEIVLENGETATVNKRPGLDQFLQKASKKFDVYVYTAGSRKYSDAILDHLDPMGTVFKGRFYRDSCCTMQGLFLKDLTILGADLARVVLVDNNPASFLYQPRNGIPVASFYDDSCDETFTALMKVLKFLDHKDDIRPELDQMFRLESILSEPRQKLLCL